MNSLVSRPPKEIIHVLIPSQGYFPNNNRIPLTLYKKAVHCMNVTIEAIKKHLEANHWINSWIDGIYDYHHYHSNTHECLVIIAGTCQIKIGEEEGAIYKVSQGDVIIFPAGVSHKNVASSADFSCIGSYPTQKDYDLKYGKADEHPEVDENIKMVQLPKCDPIYGEHGFLFDYWK